MRAEKTHRGSVLGGAVLLAFVLLALLAPAGARAALPVKGAGLQAHDHATVGKNWHVQLLVSKKSEKLLDTLVIYAEVCGATILKTKVPISDAGVITAYGTGQGKGRFAITAAFTAPDTLVGVARLTRGHCDTGPMPFTALTDQAAQHVHGPLWPPIAQAGLRALRQAQALRRRAWQVAGELFPTYAAAVARGYRPSPNVDPIPQLFHVRNGRYDRDDEIFNSRRPEALVYWWMPNGEHILVGLMFRVPTGEQPAFGGPIPIYHQHYGARTSAPMTHLWLTGDLRTAWANCAPVAALQAAHPGFSYVPHPTALTGPAAPCPPAAAAVAASTQSIEVGDDYFVRPTGVPTVTVSKGGTVVWRFRGEEPHDVSVASGPVTFASGPKLSGRYRRKMTRRGTYKLYCSIHGAKNQSMRLIVR